MSNLTRNEIIELRARALCWGSNPDVFVPIKGGGPNIERWKTRIADAKRIIKADEKAGVLMLVEEGEKPKPDDLVETPIFRQYAVVDNCGLIYTVHGVGESFVNEVKESKADKYCCIIQRANTPVYMTKKES